MAAAAAKGREKEENEEGDLPNPLLDDNIQISRLYFFHRREILTVRSFCDRRENTF